MREEFRRANEDLERYKVEMKRKEREAEERLKLYAVKKDRMEKMKKAKEEQKF